jgi:hypothetical protein
MGYPDALLGRRLDVSTAAYSHRGVGTGEPAGGRRSFSFRSHPLGRLFDRGRPVRAAPLMRDPDCQKGLRLIC